jgi:hypothetical protein
MMMMMMMMMMIVLPLDHRIATLSSCAPPKTILDLCGFIGCTLAAESCDQGFC